MVFEWNESLSVDHASLDAEHRCLIEIINRLDRAVTEGSDPETIGLILCDLSEYCAEHFDHEEREMIRLRYGEYGWHKSLHDGLMQKLSELVFRFEVHQESLPADLLAFLGEWLTGHITVEDKKLARMLHHHGS